MSYQQKLDEARALIDQHNSQIPADVKVGRVDVEKFFSNLTVAGGTNDAALSQCAWEDLQDFGLPKLLARQVAQIFRQKDEKKDEKLVLKKSKVEVMTVGELVAHYDPRSLINSVAERLKSIMGDKKFVVFEDGGRVNVSATTKLAQEILDGYSERELYVDRFAGDGPIKTYRIGERPDQSFDENPLYPGRILRPDGDCDQTNRSWSGVPLEVKQTLYLAITKTGELKVQSINDAHDIMDLFVGKQDVDARRTVRHRFSKAASLLKEMQQQGNVPMLKIFKKTAGDTKKNDPFGSAHKSY